MCTGHVKLVFEQLPLRGICNGISVCAEAKRKRGGGEQKKGGQPIDISVCNRISVCAEAKKKSKEKGNNKRGENRQTVKSASARKKSARKTAVSSGSFVGLFCLYSASLLPI